MMLDNPPSDAVVMSETFGQGVMGWMVMYEFIYHGEPFNFIFECGGPRDTERQARDTARARMTLIQARRNFLMAALQPNATRH